MSKMDMNIHTTDILLSRLLLSVEYATAYIYHVYVFNKCICIIMHFNRNTCESADLYSYHA